MFERFCEDASVSEKCALVWDDLLAIAHSGTLQEDGSLTVLVPAESAKRSTQAEPEVTALAHIKIMCNLEMWLRSERLYRRPLL